MLIAESKETKAAPDREWLRLAMLQQVPTALLCALMLDGGRMARICVSAMVGYWIGVVWLQLRRPGRPCRTDALFERWGFFSIFGISIVIASCWSRWISP